MYHNDQGLTSISNSMPPWSTKRDVFILDFGGGLAEHWCVESPAIFFEWDNLILLWYFPFPHSHNGHSARRLVDLPCGIICSMKVLNNRPLSVPTSSTNQLSSDLFIIFHFASSRTSRLTFSISSNTIDSNTTASETSDTLDSHSFFDFGNWISKLGISKTSDTFHISVIHAKLTEMLTFQ